MSAATDWIQAIGTPVAIAGLTYQTWRQRREDRQRQLDASRAKAAQARMVITRTSPGPGVNGFVRKVTVVVHNTSAEPIRDVTVSVTPPGLPPSHLRFGVIAPHERLPREWKPPSHLSEHHAKHLVVVTRFTDNGDNWWSRVGELPPTAEKQPLFASPAQPRWYWDFPPYQWWSRRRLPRVDSDSVEHSDTTIGT
jgi:hypothetical protein